MAEIDYDRRHSENNNNDYMYKATPLIEMCVIESELNENISLPDPSRVRALRFGSYGI